MKIGENQSYCMKQRISRKYPFCIFLLLLAAILTFSPTASSYEINTLLMESTFKIVGKKKSDPKKLAVGTMFIIGHPMKLQPQNAYYVMVTAAHILDEIIGDDATIYLRKMEIDGSYKKFPFEIKIRGKNIPIYVRHSEADVAVMYLTLPNDINIPIVSTALLADDKVFEKYEIHPGDELLCLGYPFLAEANEAGFPILRSGKISSYPIFPAKKVRTFLFDFRVFGGNSGGPVYMSYQGRVYQNKYHIENIQAIAGLVSQELRALPQFNNAPLEIATVVPAQFILETINLLPDLDAKPETKKD